MSDDGENERPKRRRNRSKSKDVNPWLAAAWDGSSGGGSAQQPPSQPTQPSKRGFPMLNMARILIGIVVLFVLMFVGGSFYTIDQGERGVILRTGKVVGTAQPGLGFKIPFLDKVVKISTQTQTYTWNKVNSYSADQQPADLKISVTFRVEPTKVAEIYSKFGSIPSAVQRIVSPIVNRDVKVVFGGYSAVRAIQERGKLNSDAREAVRQALEGEPLILQSLQIESIDFSREYIRSVEQRMQAEVEVQRLRQNAMREKVQAEITVTKAKAEADAVRARAQADADRIKLRGDAEASAINARGKALRDNPALIGLVQAEKWNGQLPQTMVPGGALPMLNLNSVLQKQQ
jgi:regulator of protease activity HflC (stomatin/prohibitin superfamily)